MSSFEKSVKGATKIKAAPPKTKYIEHILVATHSGEHGVAEVFRSLQNRLRDSTWTVVFKSLITVHLMIREGAQDVTLDFLSKHRSMLAISSFSDVQTQGRNIRHYASYLAERARAYKDTRCDWVRGADHRLEKATIEKGLLRETEVVQHQITALLKCNVLDNEPENEITITVFRMLVLDLLALFNSLNQALINILRNFFEMSKSDAERAMEIYRTFIKQTDYVVLYLQTARAYEHQTRVEVPKLKHAPINLAKSLQEYLSEPDFEINRRQYLAEQDAKKSGKGKSSSSKPFGASEAPSRAAVGQSFPDAEPSQSKPAPQPAKGPAPDLIDFFDSIEQNQQTMATQPGQGDNVPNFNSAPQFAQQQQFPQQAGFQTQQGGFQNVDQFQQQQQQQQQQPFMNTYMQQPQQQTQAQPIQSQFTGAGFGGYTPQPSFQPSSLSPIPQDSAASFQSLSPGGFQNQQQQVTNPFRLSMMTTGMQQPQQQSQFPVSPQGSAPMLQSQSTNPFARNLSPPQQQPFSPAAEQQSQSPFAPQQQFQQAQFPQQQSASPVVPQATGTNPFAKFSTPPPTNQQQQGLMPQPTGSTNPFRQSQFVNTATGQGWQNGQGNIGGGLDGVDTVPVFPRPGQTQAWQH